MSTGRFHSSGIDDDASRCSHEVLGVKKPEKLLSAAINMNTLSSEDLVGLLDSEHLHDHSDLQLTHRRNHTTVPQTRSVRDNNAGSNYGTLQIEASDSFGCTSPLQRQMFGAAISPFTPRSTSVSSSITRQKRVLSYVRMGSIAVLAVIVAGACVAVVALKGDSRVTFNSAATSNGLEQENTYRLADSRHVVGETPMSTSRATKNLFTSATEGEEADKPRIVAYRDNVERVLTSLRDEFEEWTQHHRRDYGSHEEKERRFQIWSENHARTTEKNKRHGPCKMTNKAVFGSNHFKDLTPEEFKNKYLTGYKGPTSDKNPNNRMLRADELPKNLSKDAETRRPKTINSVSSGSLDPKVDVRRHPSVQMQYLKHLEITPPLQKTYVKREKCSSTYGKTYVKRDRHDSTSSNEKNSGQHVLCKNKYSYAYAGYKTSSVSCDWFDVSCWLQWLFSSYPAVVGGTREPAYNSESYPSSIDWRTLGAVSSVRTQGSCGACWAITAVETVESAYFISQGTLLSLDETEIIACDSSCAMCNGGWPQNAYDYIIKYNGIPARSSYDGNFLSTLSEVTDGTSDELTSDEVATYMDSVCVSEDESDSAATRYAPIKGYGYATDRCVCYTDGTGCNCDAQDETLAVLNIASYGPAAVCLEASTWQDYSEGIITADSGCTSKFLDMNHCVQVVGYAFTDVSSDTSGDTIQRDGYWIVRNQWSVYWGMSGYAYVAMGYNTCGILNDMTQVVME